MEWVCCADRVLLGQKDASIADVPQPPVPGEATDREITAPGESVQAPSCHRDLRSRRLGHVEQETGQLVGPEDEVGQRGTDDRHHQRRQPWLTQKRRSLGCRGRRGDCELVVVAHGV
ncbi:unnamed protein product [Protopolystoma xenopodis]|uniref:Uncharacterized protein n=1 Tax=Protopolystoma xenopodis TaxID=117903 RepID=A0A3S5CR29_9PLAT|nr:unnamed protein product [Protopolystoma xenopodis]